MSRCLVIIVISFFAGSFTEGQENKSAFGLFLGFNSSSLTGSNDRIGINGGFFYYQPFGNYAGAAAELYIITKGGKWYEPTFSVFGDHDRVIYNITYLELPVYLTFKILKKNFLDLIGGGYIAYKIGALDEWVLEGRESWELPHDKLSNEIRNFNYGIMFGLRFNLGYRSTFLELKYDLSLSTIYRTNEKRAPADFSDKADQSMKTITLGLGIVF